MDQDMRAETLDPERCYRIIRSKDARFDGVFVTGVVTTGVYCRPGCPAATPRADRVRFFPTAAAAEAAGFRACKRCRPDAAPGSPDWHWRDDVVARAVRLIDDGVVDREGVAGLARRLGYSPRQLHRLITGTLGAPPGALARQRRLLAARWLLEESRVPITEVAAAAGFSSLRQFHQAVRHAYGTTPGAMRQAARAAREDAGTLALNLRYRPPLALAPLLDFLRGHAVPGIEEAMPDGGFRRFLALPHGSGVVTIRPTAHPRGVRVLVAVDDLRDLTAAVARSRRLLDLDADPAAVADWLGRDPLLGPLVRARPGRRVPGHPDPFELLIRAIIGQQVSVAAARTVTARVVERYGEPLARPVGAVTHRFPSAEALAGADPAALPMPRRRAETVVRTAAAVARGDIRLDAGTDRAELSRQLLRLPGIGPWTVGYVRMRALSDPDVFLPTDLGVRRGLHALGQADTAEAAENLARRWQPWRSYAVQYLWVADALRRGDPDRSRDTT
jgi:AraC family transcriptional regulator of adaptative response / DNA-3-methyladenine glycosylase II